MSIRKEISTVGKMGAGIAIMDLSGSSLLEAIQTQNQEDIVRASIVGAIGATIFLKALLESVRSAEQSTKPSAFQRMRDQDLIVLEDFRRNKNKPTESAQKKLQTG